MSDACGRESGHGFRQSAAAAVRGALLPRLALCAAAAAAASAQTAPVYRMDTIAGDLSSHGGVRIYSRACRTDFDGHRLPGDGGPASQALLCSLDSRPSRHMTIDGAGNIFIADARRVRRIDAATGIIDTVAGKGAYDSFYEEWVNPYRDRDVGWYYGGQAIDASGLDIWAIAADSAGNLFIGVFHRGIDRYYQVIDRVDAATGIISAFAGADKRGASGDGGPATEAEIAANSMALDGAGNLFFVDSSNAVIRRIDAATGIINTVAGGGTDRNGEGIPALEASLTTTDSSTGPLDIAVDGAGNLFIAAGFTRIRKVDAATGIINTVAGKDDFRRSYSFNDPELFGIGDGGPAVEASFIRIASIALDGAGNLFISDEGNYSLRRVDAATGIVDTIAGVADEWRLRSYADGLLGLEFSFYGPSLVADRDGNIFFFQYGAPFGSSTIGRLTPWTGGGAPAIAEGGVVLAAGTPLVERISPNALISVFGQDFAAPGEPALAAALDASGRVPVNLANTCLEIRRTYISEEGTFGPPLPRGFGDQRVPLFLVSPTQINAQAPHDLTPGEAAVLTVVQGCGTADELRNPVGAPGAIVPPSVKVAAVSPAFFNVVNNANGRNPLVAQHGGGPALVGPPELGAAFTPAAPGEVVTLYGTGFGPTEPALEAGVVPGVPADLAYPVSFRVGGKAVPPQDVLYAGAAPCCAGLHQFTLRLPADLPDGDAALTATVLGVFTPQGPFLAIRRR